MASKLSDFQGVRRCHAAWRLRLVTRDCLGAQGPIWAQTHMGPWASCVPSVPYVPCVPCVLCVLCGPCGPKFGAQIWGSKLRPKFGAQIWGPDLGPKFGAHIWAANLGPHPGPLGAQGPGPCVGHWGKKLFLLLQFWGRSISVGRVSTTGCW